MTGLDVHILIHPDTPPEWVAQCVGSVYEAQAAARFPVAVRLLPAVIGHIGRGRAEGYAMGGHAYVTSVDDDDYLLPDAFAQMREAMEAGASAICTPELIERNGWPTLTRGRDRHHLIAYRREAIIDHTRWPCCGDVAQIAAIGADAVDLPVPQYVHRVYATSKARALRHANPDELRMAECQT